MEQVQSAEKNGQQFAALHAVGALLTVIAAAGEESELVRLATTGISSLLRCRVSGIALRQRSDTGWYLVLQQGGTLLPASHLQTVSTELDVLCAETSGQGSLWVAGQESDARDERIPASLRRLGIHCLAVTPLRTLHRHIGMLLVGKGPQEAFARDEVVALQTLAEHLAVTLENLRLYHRQQQLTHDLEALVETRTAALRSSQKKYQTLLEISNALTSNLTRESLFYVLSQSLRQVLPFEVALLTLHDPEKDLLRVFALEGTARLRHFGHVGTEVSRQESHVGWVFDQKTPLLRGDLEQERQFPVEDTLLAAGIRSYIVVPLVARAQAIGTLNVGSTTPHRYAEADALFLLEIAKQIALAVENMKAYEEIAALKARLQEENIYLQEEIKTQHNFEEIIGESQALKKTLKAVETVAATDATVLLLGETGTGKELIARAIHQLSPRKQRALIKVNCAALPTGLIESELFGHEKGAFTGALSRKIGRFELANGGTIFLDEIGDLPLELQPKLLRVLQEGECERVGGSHPIKVDVRVIAATHRDLEKVMEEGKFRPDLYYRLNVFPILIPALRERTEDIPLLVKYFVVKYSRKLGKKIETIPQKAMDALLASPWPGNVRELENVIERAAILSQGPQLELSEWLPKPGLTPRGTQLPTLEELERDHILAVLELTGWRVSGEKGAAELLGMKPTTLEARMKKLGIKRKH